MRKWCLQYSLFAFVCASLALSLCILLNFREDVGELSFGDAQGTYVCRVRSWGWPAPFLQYGTEASTPKGSGSVSSVADFRSFYWWWLGVDVLICVAIAVLTAVLADRIAASCRCLSPKNAVGGKPKDAKDEKRE